jgi:GTP cyclohydrolase I
MNELDKAIAQDSVEDIISYIGEDPLREGLLETPKRYIKFLEEFLNPAPFNFTSFTDTESDEMIIVKDIPFYSLCEHHMAPFFGIGHIAYIPTGKILGISKLPRALDHFSRRLQNQERIGIQVANAIMNAVDAKGVAVVLEARHMCMEMRGIKAAGASTTTSTMLGVFKSQVNTRQEFLNLIK